MLSIIELYFKLIWRTRVYCCSQLAYLYLSRIEPYYTVHILAVLDDFGTYTSDKPSFRILNVLINIYFIIINNIIHYISNKECGICNYLLENGNSVKNKQHFFLICIHKKF